MQLLLTQDEFFSSESQKTKMQAEILELAEKIKNLQNKNTELEKEIINLKKMKQLDDMMNPF